MYLSGFLPKRSNPSMVATCWAPDTVINSIFRNSVFPTIKIICCWGWPSDNLDQVIAQTAEVKSVETRAWHGLQTVAKVARRLGTSARAPLGSPLGRCYQHGYSRFYGCYGHAHKACLDHARWRWREHPGLARHFSPTKEPGQSAG